MCVSTIKRKRNDLKLGTVVVLDSLSKSIDFGLKCQGLGAQGR